jgi:hypothetical protein
VVVALHDEVHTLGDEVTVEGIVTLTPVDADREARNVHADDDPLARSLALLDDAVEPRPLRRPSGVLAIAGRQRDVR